MVSQSIIQIIAIQMKLQVAQKLLRGDAETKEHGLSTVQKVPDSSTTIREYCGALLLGLFYDAPSNSLLRWDEKVVGLTQGPMVTTEVLLMAPLERLVVRDFIHTHHPGIVPGIIIADPLLGNRVCDENSPPPEGVPLLRVA